MKFNNIKQKFDILRKLFKHQIKTQQGESWSLIKLLTVVRLTLKGVRISIYIQFHYQLVNEHLTEQQEIENTKDQSTAIEILK